MQFLSAFGTTQDASIVRDGEGAEWMGEEHDRGIRTLTVVT